MDEVGEERKLQLNELQELKDKAYENAKIYRERTKRMHDKNIIMKDLYTGMLVLVGKKYVHAAEARLKESLVYFKKISILNLNPLIN